MSLFERIARTPSRISVLRVIYLDAFIRECVGPSVSASVGQSDTS